MSPITSMSGSEKINRWQASQIEEDGYGAGKGWKGNDVRPKTVTSGLSRVPKAEDGQRSRNDRSNIGKDGVAQSAAKFYSRGVRLTNSKASQVGRERERVAHDADSRAPQLEEARSNKSKPGRQYRNGRTADEQRSELGGSSRSSPPRVSGRTGIVEASPHRANASAKPVVSRVAGKVAKGVGSETLKAGVNRDRAGGGARVKVATSMGDADLVRQVHGSSGKCIDGLGVERLGLGCVEASPALQVKEAKLPQESTSRSCVFPIRNPIWPVAYEQQKLISKVPETRPVTMQSPPPSSRENGTEDICEGSLQQTVCERKKWGVDVAKVASHLQLHLLGEASPSPKSVLDRAQSSSPVSTEDESIDHELSAAELRFLQDITDLTDVRDSSRPVPASRADSAESLEFASLAFMGETECMEPDLEYVRLVLVASGFGGSDMPEWHSHSFAANPALFEQLEKGIAPGGVGLGGLGAGLGTVEQQRGQEERRQRMLLFDAVNEAMVRRLLPYRDMPPWQKRAKATVRPRPTGRELLQEVWSEIHDWPAPSSEVMYDILDDAARRDMVKGPYRWDDFGAEEGEVVVALEKAILEGLVEELVKEFGDIERRRRVRRAIAVAS